MSQTLQDLFEYPLMLFTLTIILIFLDIKDRLLAKNRLEKWYQYIKYYNPVRIKAIEDLSKDSFQYDNIMIYIHNIILLCFGYIDGISETPIIDCDKNYKASNAKYDKRDAIIIKKGVCRHKAFVIYVILNHYNINCSIVNGYDDTTAHSWNRIKINNELVTIDVTKCLCNPSAGVAINDLKYYKQGKNQGPLYKVMRYDHLDKKSRKRLKQKCV